MNALTGQLKNSSVPWETLETLREALIGVMWKAGNSEAVVNCSTYRSWVLHTHIYTHTDMYIHIYVHINIHAHTQTNRHKLIHTYTYPYTHT